MPDTTINAPTAIDPVDRLTLGTADARSALSPQGFPCAPCGCMAEE